MIDIIGMVIAVEALTKLLRDSEIMDVPRSIISQRSALLGELLSCGYCLSVWSAVLVLGMHYLGIDYLIYLLAFHRASNILHDIFGIIMALKINQRIPHD